MRTGPLFSCLQGSSVPGERTSPGHRVRNSLGLQVPPVLHDRIRKLFAIARDAVAEELGVSMQTGGPVAGQPAGANGKAFARLRFNVGPGGDVRIPVEVDYSQPFAPSDFDAWEAEYKANVKAVRERFWPDMELGWDDRYGINADDDRGADDQLGAELCVDDYMLAELAEMDPEERAHILDQFGLSVDDLPQDMAVFA